MKFWVGLLLALAISSSVALPARNLDDDAEFVNVPRRGGSVRQGDTEVDPDFKDFKGVVDTGDYPFLTHIPNNPFSLNSGFFDRFEDIFKRLRETIANRFYSEIPTPEDGDWPLDPSKGNTTSVVKVVDGHKIQINDTVYTKTDDTGNSIYKVRIVNIRPVDEEGSHTDVDSRDVTSSPTDDSNEANGSPEVIEKQTKDNEISKDIDLNTEMHDDTTTIAPPITTNLPTENSYDDITTEGYEILSHEQLMAQPNLYYENVQLNDEQQTQRYMDTLESEFSDEYDHETNNDDYNKYNVGTEFPYPTEFETFDNNYENNNIDIYDSIPIDLSNDIAINQILADQGAAHNPDVEVFSVEEFQPNNNNQKLIMPKYSYHYQPLKSSPMKIMFEENNYQPIKK